MGNSGVGALPRSVLILAGIENGPYRYRVVNLAEELRLLGIPATVLHHHDEQALQAAADHELVIFQRVPFDDYVGRLVSRARNAGALAIFGIDDLLFEPAHPPPFLAGLDRGETENWLHMVRAYRQLFDMCDAFLGSTQVLAQAATELGKPSFVHRNALSQELIDRSRAAAAGVKRSEQVRLGYFSGTRTHARDFAVLSPVLARVLLARPQARLQLVGALTLPRELERFNGRIERAPVVPWRALPALLAQADINLAPLELDERFCHAKSELKWFEAAVAGVPTVATPTEPFKLAIRDGENGFLARTEEQWERALLALVDDPGMRTRVANAALADALTHYGPAASVRRLEPTLRSLNGLRPQRDLRGGPRISSMDVAGLKASGMGIGQAAIEPFSAIAGPDQLAVREASVGIQGARTASQAFDCPAGLLYRIDLLVGTHRRLNAHDIHLRLIETRTQKQLAHASADAANACDNAWMQFEFGPVALAVDTGLTFLVEAPAALHTEGLAVWLEPSLSGRGRAADRDKLDLTFRTFLHPPGWAPAQPARDPKHPLEERVERLENQLAAARFEIVALQRQVEAVARAKLGMNGLRGTLPYKAARKIYRMIKP